MTKEQAAEKYANKVLNGTVNTLRFADIEDGFIAGWEAHEAQSTSDDIAFAEWCSFQGWHNAGPGKWYGLKSLTEMEWVTTEELYKRFNPSGAAPENKYPIGGYAPGNYTCKCTTCGDQFRGDKRAVQCEPCAVKMTVEAEAPKPKLPDSFYNCLPAGYEFVNEDPLISNNYGSDDEIIEGQYTLSMLMVKVPKPVEILNHPNCPIGENGKDKNVFVDKATPQVDIDEKCGNCGKTDQCIVDHSGERWCLDCMRLAQYCIGCDCNLRDVVEDLFNYEHDECPACREKEMSKLSSAPQAVGPVWVKGNYERLYARVKGGKRTECYVDYDFFKDGKPPIRDIASIKPEQMEISARGICYAMMSSSCASEKERFVEMCESVNVEWLDESNAHQVFTREQVQAILTTLEKQPEYSKIYGYLDWFNTNYPPSI